MRLGRRIRTSNTKPSWDSVALLSGSLLPIVSPWVALLRTRTRAVARARSGRPRIPRTRCGPRSRPRPRTRPAVESFISNYEFWNSWGVGHRSYHTRGKSYHVRWIIVHGLCWERDPQLWEWDPQFISDFLYFEFIFYWAFIYFWIILILFLFIFFYFWILFGNSIYFFMGREDTKKKKIGEI